MTNTATKTKRTKIEERRPPRDVRESTAARRAWLADELARVNATDGLEGKVVGLGSYQVVAVYKVEQVAGRLRFRGHCQCCGRPQVVDGGALVLHGYKRPGDGQTYGRCPGMGEAPLQVSQALTEAWHAAAVELAATTKAELEAAAAAERLAIRALHASDEMERAWREVPYRPVQSRRQSDAEYLAALEAWRPRRDAWAAKFPLAAARDRAEVAHRDARDAEWQARQTRDHFAHLLGMQLLGTALVEEVVP